MNALWTPGSSGAYYFVASWSWNIIQYAAALAPDVYLPCTPGSASAQITLFIGVWDNTSSTNVFQENTTVELNGSNDNGWCDVLDQAAVGTSAESETFYEAGSQYLTQTDSYQFRSSVNFVTQTDCDYQIVNGCSTAEAQINTGTNYDWTLNYFDVDQ